MRDPHPITTSEMLVIAGKELAKEVPILKNIISAQESVFNTIEMNRVKLALTEVFARLDKLSNGAPQVLDEKATSVLNYGAEQVRSDILAEPKAKVYGSVIAHYIKEPADLNEVSEVLDCLRKLSATDLKVLYQFRIGGKLIQNRAVAELIGYQAGINPLESAASLKRKMEATFPTLMRLQGLGVIYLSMEPFAGLVHDIGGLSQEIKKTAYLTAAGARLVQILP
jgi:hypothetical protein